jgi:hypothetical protein
MHSDNGVTRDDKGVTRGDNGVTRDDNGVTRGDIDETRGDTDETRDGNGETGDIETAARQNLSGVLKSGVAPGELDLDLDMVDDYGLTSLNKVLFLMSVCDDTGVSMARFTEPDVAAMRTLRDVTAALARHERTVA